MLCRWDNRWTCEARSTEMSPLTVKYVLIDVFWIMSSAFGFLPYQQHYLPFTALRVLYYSLVYPYLIYGVIVWGSAELQLVNKLTVLQNKIIRIITNSKYNTSCNAMYTKANCLKFVDIYKFFMSIFYFQFLHNMLPPYFSQFMNLVDTSASYNLRSSVLCNYTKSNIRHKHPFFSGPSLWVNLHPSVKSCTNLYLF